MISGITQSASTAYSGNIDLTELKARQQEMFAAMDTNGDGTVDKAEFSDFSQQMAEKMKEGPSSEEMFAEMDTDGDDSVSRAEFESFRPAPPKGMTPPSPEEMFSSMDTNGDGSIDQTEFEAFSASRPKGGPSQPSDSNIFSEMDTDANGSVTAAEFQTFGEKMELARLDGHSVSPTSTEDEVTATLLDYLEESESSESSAIQTAYQRYALGLDSGSLSVLNLLG